MKRAFSAFLVTLLAALATGCTSQNWNNRLPASSELGSPRGFRIARTAIHVHSPFSWDACDKNGFPGGSINTECLSHLRSALCSNRIDFAHMTDHPNNMAKYEFENLLMHQASDQWIEESGNKVGNEIACGDGTKVITTVGFEDRLIAAAMDVHADADIQTRTTLYTEETAASVTTLKTDTDAVVIVPHIESRDMAVVDTLGMDAIEVYNFHANVDPKIRGRDLGLDYFRGVADLLLYLFDPYQKLQPDLAILSFYQWHPKWRSRWNTLISTGHKVAGVASNDSHENVLSYKANDGERIDSHRRILRWFSNHLLVNALTIDENKAAIRQGRGWWVFEAAGSPVGMDFYADNGTTTIGVGETGTYAAGTTTLTVKVPHLHPDSPQNRTQPTVTVRVVRVTTGGEDEVIGQATNSDLSVAVTQVGQYRAQVGIDLRHLEGYFDSEVIDASVELPWIVSNHLYLE